MIEIRHIEEPVCSLYDPEDKLVGTINSLLQFTDVRVQIRRPQVEGYYVMWGMHKVCINKNGKLNQYYPIGLYDQFDDMINELIGL